MDAAFRQLVDLAVATVEAPFCDNPWATITQAVTTVVGGSVGMLQRDLCMDDRSAGVLAWTNGRSLGEGNDLCVRLGFAHPLAPALAGGRTDVVTVSDVVGDLAWRRNVNHRAAVDVLDGAIRQMAVPLYAGAGRIRCYMVGRPGRDFGDRERALARVIQPLLDRIDRHVYAVRGLPVRAAADVGLSPRELTVLALVGEGLTAVSIGRRLGIAAQTVSKHQQRIYRRLGVQDRLTAVLVAQEMGNLPGRRT